MTKADVSFIKALLLLILMQGAHSTSTVVLFGVMAAILFILAIFEK